MYNNSQDANKSDVIKDYIFVILVSTIGMLITILVFIRIFSVSRQSIKNMWNSETLIMSKQVEQYLNVPKDAILFTSKGVEDLIEHGATNEDIKAYLGEGTSVISDLVESNYTGIYGYVNGEYLDSSGWEPPADFKPISRPWYIDAVRADGEVAFVEPYFNVQTNTLMMSVSKLLKDKKSVLSMDIFLDTLQKIDKEMLQAKELEAAFVIDSDGIIVAHSDEKELGKDYLHDEITFHHSIMEGIHAKDSNIFSFLIDGVPKIAYSNRINDQWYTVFIFDEKELFKPVWIVYLQSSLVLFIVFIAFILSLRTFKKRHIETKQLQGELAAISDIYLSLSILDLKELKLKKMWVSERLTEILSSGNFSLTRVDEIVKAIAIEPSRNLLEQFMNFSTVAERLQNTKSISHEFIDIDNHWTRMYFIAGNRDKDGNLLDVIWATESIDEDRRRQEELRKKAETDALTNILNRAGGESRVYEAFECGKKGMLMILDADHFKHVNDTYGHDVGDQVIISIANCLSETFRDSDIVFRLGGDEFSVFASGVDNEGIGRLVADRLFANIFILNIPGVTDWKLNISVGATFCNPENSTSFEDYLKQADTAMYESKQHEGSYITFYSGSPKTEISS